MWLGPTPTFGSPLTTKGDLHVYTTVDARLVVGADGEILESDSAEASGVKWVARGWGTFTAVWTNLTVGNGVVVARFVENSDGTVTAYIILTFGTTTTIDGTGVEVDLPVAEATNYGAIGMPVGQSTLKDDGQSGHSGRVAILNGKANIQVFNTSSTHAKANNISATVPFTWATDDVLQAQWTYEAA